MNAQRGTTAFLVVISAVMLISGMFWGAPTRAVMGLGPFSAVASADTAFNVVYGTAGMPGGQQVVFVPGTGNPGEKGAVYTGHEYVVPYSAQTPVFGNYAASVVQGGDGAANAVRTLPPGTAVVLSGHSQGGHAARLAAVQPGVASGYPVTVVTTGDPCTEGTGILHRFPLAQLAAGVPCAPIPPGAQAVVINHAQDPIANFPLELNGITAVNALIEYTYYHTHGYGPVDFNRADAQVETVGNVTYVTIPRDQTPALVRFAREHNIPLAPEVERWIADATYRPDPGPQNVPPAATPVYNVATAPAEPLLGFAVPSAMVEPVLPAPVLPPAPVGNVASTAEAAKLALPPEAAPMVDHITAQVQASPLGAWLNGLPPLGF